MVSEAAYKEVLDENRMLNSKVAALTFELDNLKRAFFSSSSERHSGSTPDASLPSLFPTEAPVNQEAPATEQIAYECRKPSPSKNLPDRLDVADHGARGCGPVRDEAHRGDGQPPSDVHTCLVPGAGDGKAQVQGPCHRAYLPSPCA
jgi:hypothetical protein